MGLFKKKKKKEEANFVRLATDAAYKMGTQGTEHLLHGLLLTAEEETAKKKTAYYDYARKTDYGSSLFSSFEKSQKLKNEFYRAEEAQGEIKTAYYKGAYEAFLGGDIESLQTLLTHPQDFLRDNYDSADDLVTRTLIGLVFEVKEAADQAAMLVMALEKTTKEDRKNHLDNALECLLKEYNPYPEAIAAVLNAGANPGDNGSISLAYAIQKDAPAEIKDLLLAHGADLDAAIATMKRHSGYFGDMGQKLAEEKAKQSSADRIRELEETVADLTKKLEAKKDEPAAPKPKPAKKADDSLSKIRKFGNP